jgi:hypothetical protein
MADIYLENGFVSRNDYLFFISVELGVNLETVYSISNKLGAHEDFTGLINSLKKI